ncbi:hypothetical protein FPRO05_06151 [Fusarium proliferatum]|uniref:AB hydrolase-1 domain-containing protein n=1 Tax=Gibberella intermedia TaxID=948311 RepID=A0A365MP34_GIBIN|nr:hypothetical protein FPRO05_06151 [Fusarium proliferatum]
MASHSTYDSNTAWRLIQDFLPRRLHFTKEHSPTEETWETRGHKLHIDRWVNPAAKAIIILHHGIGTNGREMSMILGVPLHMAGFEVVAVDMPGYGMTKCAPGTHSYSDWVDIGCDFLEREQMPRGLPVFLYGLSAGGFLSMQIAGKMKVGGRKPPSGMIAMCFIDIRDQAVSDMSARNLLCSRVGFPAAHLMNWIGMGWFRMPFSWVAKMTTLANDPKCLKICLQDDTSAAASVSMKFLSSLASYTPAQDWEEFNACPILLTFPMKDRWVTLDQSKGFLGRAAKAEWEVVELENAGHYPLEDPGLQQMADGIIRFVNAKM